MILGGWGYMNLLFFPPNYDFGEVTFSVTYLSIDSQDSHYF